MNYHFGFQVKQIDTHVKGTLIECQIDKCNRVVSKKVLKDYIVFPKEIFLYWCLKKLISQKAIEKTSDFIAYAPYYNTLVNPSKLKIGGEYKRKILGYREIYEITVAVLAVDEDFGKVDISTSGTWNYSFGQFILRKSLLEKLIKTLNPSVVFPTIWTDIEYRLKKLKPQIYYSDILTPFRENLLNTIELILESPVTVLFSNLFKLLAPDIEGIVKTYIEAKNIKGIKTNNLSTMVGGIAQYQGNEFSKEFKEYFKLALEPIRNLSSHGGLPSETVCNFLIIIIFELIEELLTNENV